MFRAAFQNKKVIVAGASVGGGFVLYNCYSVLNEDEFSSLISTGNSTVTCEKQDAAPPKLVTIPSRAEQLVNLKSGKEFDVLVVGGGATGSGAALDAASRGLSTALIERGDFGNETSSRSTKLIWVSLRMIHWSR